jgi:2-phospho-L-lactate transferase/gluconeogenesis factor (CofD/UPF0052 family)
MLIKKVALFCGGSGSETIIKYLVNQKDIKLTLIVNAFDDGKSTGILRKNIPGLLGPSDFRKNFSYLVNLFSNEQRNIKKIFEYRFKKKILINDFYISIKNSKNINKYLPNEINFLEKKNDIFDYLLTSTKFLSSKNIDLLDFSLGNLIFVGIFLIKKKNFNLALKKFTSLINTNVEIINISNNKNRWLVALNNKNKIISNESNLVQKKQYAAIKEIFLIEKEFVHHSIDGFSKERKIEYLRKINSIPKINHNAKNCILKSNFIIYGPGTQHSSLFPSYIIANKYIKKSKAKKVMIMNLDHDNDIMNLNSTQILTRALKYLNFKKKTDKVINTVLIDRKCKFNNLNKTFKGIEIINTDLRDSFFEKKHSGRKIYNEIFYKDDQKKNLTIFINSIDNDNFILDYLDQITNINYLKFFNKMTIIINGKINKLLKKKNIIFKNIKENFAETFIFNTWYKNKTSNYLVTINGDGYYDTSKIIQHITLMKDLDCGLLIGSRNQNRSQHFENIKKLYGTNKLLYFFSKFTELFFIITFFFKLKFILTDPHSGYRIYSKKNVKSIKIEKTKIAPSALLKKLVKEKTEVFEVPIKYYVKRNLSSIIKRFSQAVNNIKGLYFD